MIRRSVAMLALLAVAVCAAPAEADEREDVIIAAMRLSEDQLGGALRTSPWRDDPLFLAAVAQNPAATAVMLDEIARRDDPKLQEKLHASRALLGRNWKGLAVMRLVALHANVTEATLVRLADSRNDYVLNTVLANPKTPEAVLRRYAGRKNYLYDWGIGHNPRTPPELLRPLADSGNQYTRSAVAGNPQTPPDVLERLAQDKEWHVRRDVAMNPAAPRELLDTLAADSDARVRQSADSVKRRGNPRR